MTTQLMNNFVKPIFPEAKFTEAEDPDLEDDMVELNEEFHIQLGQDYMVLNHWNESEGTLKEIASAHSRSSAQFIALINKAKECSK